MHIRPQSDELIHDVAGAFEPLKDVAGRMAALRTVLDDLLPDAPEHLRAGIRELRGQLDDFSPRVALIGQVKAGKTALANALIGRREFLPSDVNPWTSVVTSVHLNRPAPGGHRAVFRFFDTSDWDDLVTRGGRLGELAKRAGTESDQAELEGQVEALKRHAEERLGRNFGLLLGQSHRFSECTDALVRRYVCQGDPEESETEGRFADLTKSADLFLDAPDYVVPITIEDTPGVNDPFLMRERMTLDALGRASVCVLVLSAYQALTNMDVGLLKALATLDAEEVIIFVNRVDELESPAAEVPAIEASIRSILADRGLGTDIDIVFGSATLDLADPRAMFHSASNGLRSTGVLALRRALAERIAAGPSARFLESATTRAADLIEQASRCALAASQQTGDGDPLEVFDRLDRMIGTISDDIDRIAREFDHKLSKEYRTTLRAWTDRAAARLGDGDGEGDGTVETADLRRDLASVYSRSAGAAMEQFARSFAVAGRAMRDIYELLLGDETYMFPVAAPRAPGYANPSLLAQTITLDAGGSWRDRLSIRATRADLREQRFRRTCLGEFEELLGQLRAGPAMGGTAAVRHAMHGFVASHLETMRVLADDGESGTRRAALAGRGDALAKKLAGLRSRLDAPAARAAGPLQ